MRPTHKPLPDVYRDHHADDALPMGDVITKLHDICGEYCAYCEMRLGGGYVLHHKLQRQPPDAVRKADWPHLNLICYDCRRHKTRDSLTEDELDDYLWPDQHPSFSLHGHSPLRYLLRPVPYVIHDFDGSEERIDQEFVFVEVNPRAPPALQAKAAKTIELFQLNSPHYDADRHVVSISREDHMRIPCHRLQQRTLAWTRAKGSVSRIRQMRALPEAQEHPGLVEMLRQQVNHTAHATGNWSVWMTHFWQELGEKDLIKRTFLETAEENPGFHFPGTAHDRLEWEAL